MDSYAGGIHLLYDFKYTIPGGKKGPVLVKAGEQYRLIEKKTDRWLAVSRLDGDDVLYVPTSYTQEIQYKPSQTSDNKIPPRLPVKPKNLFEKMQKNLKVEPPSPPPIDEDAHIELYNILSGNAHKLPLHAEQHKLTSHGETFDGNKTSHLQDEHNKNRLSQSVFIEDAIETNEHEEDHQELMLHEEFDDINVPQPTTINGYEVYVDEVTGKQYYYNPKTKTSSWTLPHPNFEDQSNFYANLNEDSSDILPEKSNYSPDEFHNEKESTNSVMIDHLNSTSDDPFTMLKSGPINRLKLSENGRKLKKHWTQSIMMLDGSNLYFFKDQKSSTNKSKSDVTIDLTSSFVVRGGTSNKQNLIQVITSSGTEYLLQSDDQNTITDWYQSLSNAVTVKPTNPGDTMFFSSKSDDNNNVFKPKKNGNLGSYLDLSKTPASPSAVSLINATYSTTNSLEKSKFKERLKLWILKRPTKETLREKGIYKDGIFGSTLSMICEKEGTEVPLFVTHCIEAVEERGLTVDGIYRANGNMAEIQKLRFAVNTNGSQSLLSTSSSLVDIHVITGALKLFFRELQEPLFPFDHFNSIMNVFNNRSKAQAIKNILTTLPHVNYQTLYVLLRHLLIVVSHSNENRMHIHNLSIVFGPTLMWPKESSDQNLAVSMVMRCQLVEMLLQDYSFYFDSMA